MPRLTSKGQVTIPVAVRFALGLRPGDDVVFAVEDGRGVFRAADGALGRAGSLPLAPRAAAHPLERLLATGDEAFAAALREARASGARVRVPDAVVLDLLGRFAAAHGGAATADAFRDVLAERGLRLDHRPALADAVEALAGGADPLAAYAAARA